MLGLFRHRRVAALLSSYIDGQVTREERIVVEGHLPGCDTCSRDRDELRQTASLMSGLPVLAPGRTYVLSSLAPQEAPARRPAYALFAPGIAAAACAVLLVVIVSGQAAGVLVQSGADKAMFESSADAPMAADHDMFESQADEPMTEDMAADYESFTTFGEETASDEQVEEELARVKVAEEESAEMEMTSEMQAESEEMLAPEEFAVMALAQDDMAEESDEASQLSSLEVSARDVGSEEDASDDQDQPEAALTADVTTVVVEEAASDGQVEEELELAKVAEEESAEMEMPSEIQAESEEMLASEELAVMALAQEDMADEAEEAGLEVSARDAGSEEDASDDQDQPEAALTADAAAVVDEEAVIEEEEMAGARLAPSVARPQPDEGTAEVGLYGRVELPLWQIEVGVGAVLVLLLIAAYSAGRKRR